MSDDSMTVQLLSLGYSRAEIAVPEGMPEQLVLSSLVEPLAFAELKSLAWFARAERRHLLAFERLKRTQRIILGPGARWQAFSAPKEEPPAAPLVAQRSLF